VGLVAASQGTAAAFASLEEEHQGTAVTASASWEDLIRGRALVGLGTLATTEELIQGIEADLLVASSQGRLLLAVDRA